MHEASLYKDHLHTTHLHKAYLHAGGEGLGVKSSEINSDTFERGTFQRHKLKYIYIHLPPPGSGARGPGLASCPARSPGSGPAPAPASPSPLSPARPSSSSTTTSSSEAPLHARPMVLAGRRQRHSLALLPNGSAPLRARPAGESPVTSGRPAGGGGGAWRGARHRPCRSPWETPPLRRALPGTARRQGSYCHQPAGCLCPARAASPAPRAPALLKHAGRALYTQARTHTPYTKYKHLQKQRPTHTPADPSTCRNVTQTQPHTEPSLHAQADISTQVHLLQLHGSR